MPKVFVVQEDPKKNLLPAQAFGKIVMLHTDSQLSLDEAIIEDTIDDMADKLADFNPQVDSLLLIGDPSLIAIASALVSHITNGSFTVLKWDRQRKEYHRITLDLGVS